MAEIGIAIAVIGIILTIVLSEPAIRWLRRNIDNRRREQWSADLQVDKARISELKHYAYEFWKQEINVDKDGNAVHRVEARIINIGDRLLNRVTFPIYCDATDVHEEEIQPWAKIGNVSLPVEVEDWIPARARGRVAIQITPPLQPGERRKVRWGYKLPKTFAPGDEYYNWDVATPHYEIGGMISFEEPWRIRYARWDAGLAETQQPLTVDGRSIKWLVCFPKIGERITLRFGLDKSSKPS